MNIKFIHKYETCNKSKVSVGEVIDPICVMACCESSAVCNGRKCDGSWVIADNMVESDVI